MFIFFLITVTLALILTAAYFSVFGIASMFAYNYIPAMIMGITLEAGKIGVAIYLFRYWILMGRLFKYILLTFLVALMFITSVGIFGFLSQGYQKTSEEFGILSIELANLENEFEAKKARMEVLNAQITTLPTDSVANKIRLSREFSDEQAEIRDRFAVIEPKIQQLKVKRLAYESHIGPIAYVARMLHANQDNVVFFAILMLVFVADPLAITLTIACNMVLMRYWENTRPRAEQTASPMMFNHFVSEIKAVANDTYAKYREKKEAKQAEKLAKQAEAEKKAEMAHKAEEARLARLAREAEKLRKAEQAKHEKLAREAAKAKQAEEAKLAKLAKKAAAERKAEAARQAAELKKAEAAKKADEARLAAAAKKAETAKKADEARKTTVEKAAARKIARTRKPAAARKVAPVRKSKPVKKAVPIKKTAPVKKSAPVKKTRPAKKTSPAKKKAPVKKTATRKTVTPKRKKTGR
jgi:hypothetical protein